MFKFFKKETEDKEPQKKEESEYISLDSPEIAGSITYYFKHDDDNTYLDLHLSDFEDKTIDKFSEIIAGISSLRMQLETVNMIKDVFLEMEEGDTLETIETCALEVSSHVLKAINSAWGEEQQDTSNP